MPDDRLQEPPLPPPPPEPLPVRTGPRRRWRIKVPYDLVSFLAIAAFVAALTLVVLHQWLRSVK